MTTDEEVESLFDALLAIEDAGQLDDPHLAIAQIAAAINQYDKRRIHGEKQPDPLPAPEFGSVAIANAIATDLFVQSRSAHELPFALAEFLCDVGVEPLSSRGEAIIELALKVIRPVIIDVPACERCGRTIALRKSTVLRAIRLARWRCSTCRETTT